MYVRPVIHIPYSAFEIIVEGVSILGLLVAIMVMTTNWSELPGRIPLHFGLDGKPDGWGSKKTLTVLPILCLFLYATSFNNDASTADIGRGNIHGVSGSLTEYYDDIQKKKSGAIMLIKLIIVMFTW